MTRNRLIVAAEAVRNLSYDAPQRIEAALRRMTLLAPDGYPGTGSGPGQINTVSDPTGDAVMDRTTGTGPGYNIADDHELIGQNLAMIAGLLHGIYTVTDRWTLAEGVIPRCSRLIDPDCTNVRSDGASNESDRNGLCVECWTKACPKCHTRPVATDPPRRLDSGLLGCEACDRAERRRTASRGTASRSMHRH